VGAAIVVALQTLERAARLVDDLGDLDDPADVGPTVLAALAELLGCDVATLTKLMRARVCQPIASAPSHPGPLSPRELAVLHLVGLGRTNVAIARAMGVSPRTVAKHLEHVYRKLKVSNRAAAVAKSDGWSSDGLHRRARRLR
jgi:DNA-binding CsgD family transcriptional regulator